MAKISIKLATKERNSFDLSANHFTTTDFGQIQVSNFLPVIPNDSINVSVFNEARFAPMVVPTFMDVKLVTRAFYVPMSAIYQPFEYFYTDRKDASVFKTMPTFTNAQLVTFFTTASNAMLREVDSDYLPDVTIGGKTYIYTEKGRIFKKLLHSLGYGWNFNTSDTTAMSLLPLLAFARVCYDYVYPSQYLDGLGLTAYFKVSSSSDYSALFGTQALLNTFFDKVCDLLTLPYKQDYFTASWKSLNAPGSSVQSFTKSAADSSQFTTDGDNVKQVSGSSSLSQYGVKVLQRLYEFVTRNNIVGVRYADQLFARFGIGSRKSDPDMSQFIGQNISSINVVDVTAMSSAENQDLGDLAGKAYLQGNGNLFSFDSIDEFGYIVTLSFLMPNIGYYQGRKRWTIPQSRFDFVIPEFDMQMRAVRNDELFADFNNDTEYTSAQNYGGNPANRFSFAPTYSEYKKGDDTVDGDFRVPSLSSNLKPYYLMRDIPTPSPANPLALNAQFLFMQQHEFDKIFAQPYALRAPFGLRDLVRPELGVFGLVTYNNLPLIIRVLDSSQNVIGGFVMTSRSGYQYLVPVDITDSFVAELLGFDINDPSTFIALDPTKNSTSDKYTISGIEYTIYDQTSSQFIRTGYNAFDVDSQYVLRRDNYIIKNFDYFLTPYQDYIDHVYMRYYFDIKATRSLVPISEEFMIEDGGNLASVDMNGNRIV